MPVPETRPTAVATFAPGPSAADTELNFSVSVGSTVSVGVACDGAPLLPGHGCGLYVNFTTENGGSRTDPNALTMVTMTVVDRSGGRPSGPVTFPLFADESTLPVRIMTDTRSVEVFAGYGRGVYTSKLSSNFCASTNCLITVMGKAATLTSSSWGLESL